MSSPSTFCHFILRKPYHENFRTTFLMALKLQVQKIRKLCFQKENPKKVKIVMSIQTGSTYEGFCLL